MMTWLNTAARVLSLTVVIPLVVRAFAPADIAVFYLFSSIITLQLVIGVSFVHTFARIISYVLAGARIESLAEAVNPAQPRPAVDSQIDAELFGKLWATTGRVFRVLAWVSIPVSGLVGSLLLIKPISATESPGASWCAWAVVVVVTPLVIVSYRYSALLQGANQIALEQRWSALFVIGGALSGIVALSCNGGLFALVVVNQVWQVASFLRLRWLATGIIHSLPVQIETAAYCPVVLRAIWPASWRSLVGIFSGLSATVLSSLWFAQVLTAKPLAEMLFGIRIMSVISELCRAPFYSKIPQLNRLRLLGERDDLVALAKKGMKLSYFSFVSLTLITPAIAQVGLPWIGSHISFPPIGFWLLLCAANLFERFGAMHMQLYSTTNHIILHWLNGWACLISLTLTLLLTPVCGIYAYPLGLLTSMAGFYTWIAVHYSLRSLRLDLWQFERSVFVPAFSFQAIGSIIVLYWAVA